MQTTIEKEYLEISDLLANIDHADTQHLRDQIYLKFDTIQEWLSRTDDPAVKQMLFQMFSVFNQGIMLRGTFMEIVVSLVSALIAIYLVVIGFEGWMLTGLTLIERCILVVAAILIPFPLIFSQVQGIFVGIILLAVFYVLQRNRRAKHPAAHPVRA